MTLSMPRSAPAPFPPREVAPPAPVAVEHAYRLWIAGSAVGAISGVATVVVALVLAPSITARVIADGGDPAVAGPAAVRSVLAWGLVEVALAAMGYLAAPFLREGRGWARVVLTLVGVVGVGALLGSAANSHPGLTLLSAVGVLAVLVAVLYAHQPRASAWFRSLRRAAR